MFQAKTLTSIIGISHLTPHKLCTESCNIYLDIQTQETNATDLKSFFPQKSLMHKQGNIDIGSQKREQILVIEN